jgi:hypothetical protein
MNSEQAAHPVPTLYARCKHQLNCIRQPAAQAVNHIVGKQQRVRINPDVDLTDRATVNPRAIWIVPIILHSADSGAALTPLAGLRRGRYRRHRGAPSPRPEVIR